MPHRPRKQRELGRRGKEGNRRGAGQQRKQPAVASIQGKNQMKDLATNPCPHTHNPFSQSPSSRRTLLPPKGNEHMWSFLREQKQRNNPLATLRPVHEAHSHQKRTHPSSVVQYEISYLMLCCEFQLYHCLALSKPRKSTQILA